MNKVVESPAAAVADISDGASILFGGFGVLQGWATSCILALRDRGVRNLTLISNTAGFGPTSPEILVENHQISKLIASISGVPYRKSPIEEQIATGEVELELVPQGTLVERVRAGGAGIPGFYTATGLGTEVESGKEIRELDGKSYLFEKALTADYAIIRASKADTTGNLLFRRGARNFHPLFAMGGRCTIAEVDEIVPPGELDPEAVATPGIFVDRVVLATTRFGGDDLIRLMRQLGRAVPEGSGEPGIPPDLMAARVAALFCEGDYVNLGLGLPTLCSNYIGDRDVTLHAENGLLNYGGFPDPGNEDFDLYNAGGQLVTLRPGAACFHSADSFAMARGGHVDKIVLGGFQVAENGDLANWKIPGPRGGTIGGAMDLASGGGEVIVMMTQTTKEGDSKLVRHCTYPLTGLACVSKVVTNLAYIDVVPGTGFVLREVAPGITTAEVQVATNAPLAVAPDVGEMTFG